MRKFAIAIAFSPFMSISQNVNVPMDGNKNVIYSQVVPIEGVTQDALYGKAKLWFANSFNSAQDVIQMDDKQNGVIVGKGITIINEPGMQPVRKTWYYTIKIQVKDGKYKAEIYDMERKFEMPGNNIGHKPATASMNTMMNSEYNYKKDGTMKKALYSTATESNDLFYGILESINRGMAADLKDDF